MLLNIKSKITGWVAYVIVGIITVPFALWGINFYFQGASDPLLAEVGDEELTVGQYRAAYLEKKRELEEAGGGIPNPEQLRDYVLSGLLRIRFIREELNLHRYTVPEELIVRAIANTEAFQTPEGVFDEDLFFGALRRSGRTISQFKKIIYQSLLDTQLRVIVEESAYIVPSENKHFQNLLSQERKIRYIVLDADHYLGKIHEEDARKHYEKKKYEYYTTPLKFKVAYIEIDLEKIEEELSVDVSEEEALAVYEENRENYTYPEQRQVAHIWIDKEIWGEEQAQQRVQQAYRKLEDGVDFATVAEEYSDDLLTKDAGGELPQLQEDDLEEPMRGAVFTLEENEISEPLTAEQGVQIFKLLEIMPQIQKTFEEMKDEIADQIKLQQGQEIYFSKIAEIEELAYEVDSLKEIAEETNLQYHATDWETEKSFTYLKNKEFRRSFYDKSVFYTGQISPVIKLSPKQSIVFRMLKREEPRVRSMEEVREEIEQRVSEWQSRQAAEKMAKLHIKQMMEGKKHLGSNCQAS